MDWESPDDKLWQHLASLVLARIRDQPFPDPDGQPARYEFVDMLTADTLEFLTDALMYHLSDHNPPFRRLFDTRAPEAAFEALAQSTILTCLNELQTLHATAHLEADRQFGEELSVHLESLLLTGKWMESDPDMESE